MSCTPANSFSTLFENAFYIGMNLQDILYGIELVLYFNTMQIFLGRRREPRKSDMFYAAFSTVMLSLITIWVAVGMTFGQKMWLLDRNYPGGPDAYAKAHTSDVYMDVGTVAVIILQLMTDGLMVYRCRIVWGSLRAIITPSILWFATLVLGILSAWASCMPGTNFFRGTAAKIGLAYYSVSVFLNITLTCMICYRLVRHMRTVKEYLGEEHASLYFSIVMLLVESVLPYTLSGIAFLVSYGVGSHTEIAFTHVCMLMMCVSAQMLILRVAEGKAWQKASMKAPVSVIMFSSGGVGTTEYFEESGASGTHLATLPKLGEDKV